MSIDTKKYDTIVGIIYTEKSSRDLSIGKYYFEVLPKSTKNDIQKAVEAVFGVEVEKVNIVNSLGKTKRFRGKIGKRPDSKKAIVTVKPGQTINYEELK